MAVPPRVIGEASREDDTCAVYLPNNPQSRVPTGTAPLHQRQVRAEMDVQAMSPLVVEALRMIIERDANVATLIALVGCTSKVCSEKKGAPQRALPDETLANGWT